MVDADDDLVTEPPASTDEPVATAEIAAEAAETTAETESETGAEAGAEAEGEAEGGAPDLAVLEHEGEIAADYLEALLDILDLDGDLDLDVEGERASVAIVGEGLDYLVGPHGTTLESLQELTRLAVLRQTGERSRLMLDIGGWRIRRRAELVTTATGVAERVARTGQEEKLAPMTPFERKVVHDTISAAEGVVSESEGEEPQRRVVVHPA